MFWRKWLGSPPARSADAASPQDDPGASPLPNAYWVLQDQLLAGEYPGNPDGVGPGQRLDRLIEHGIDFFVDLTRPGELPPYQSFLPAGVEYRRHPILDHSLPESPAQMAAIVAEIGRAIAAGRRVYLHCRAGIGRTGTTAGCLLVERGLSGDDALYELNRLWRQCARADDWNYVPETDEQIEYVRQWPRARVVAAPVRGPAAYQAAASYQEPVSPQGPVSFPDRAVGAMLGLAIADTLALASAPGTEGVPLEGALPAELGSLPWTDDTAMAMCLADSLLRQNGFDAHDQVERYTAWQQQGVNSATGRCIGITPTTARALALAQWRRQVFAGSHDPGQSEPESLSRLIPVVLFFFGSRAEAIEQAADASRTTSQSPAVLDACRLLAAMLHDALAGHDKARILAPDLQGFALGSLKGRLRAVVEGSPAGQRPPAGACHSIGSVLDAALWAFHSTSDFAAGLQSALGVTGRSDVIAAVYGQLAGAHYGVQAIPRRWRETVLRADLITGLAAGLTQTRN